MKALFAAQDPGGANAILPVAAALMAHGDTVVARVEGAAQHMFAARGFPLAKALGRGRLALADPAAVPAGRYAKAALTALGVWTGVAARVAPAENVRAAMALVERGATPLGIVYATDARASKAVRVVGIFPASTHPPIRYPVALLTASRHREAAGFRAFLLSKQGRAIFTRHGFSAP